MTNNTNTSAIALAVSMVREGKAKVELGVAALASALLPSWETPMRAIANEGKSNERVWFFSFADIFTPRMKEDDNSKVDGLFLRSAYVAIGDNFGIEGGLSGKDMIEFKRAWRIAAAKQVLAIDVEFSEAGAAFPIQSVFPVTETETLRVECVDADGELVLDEEGETVTELVETEKLTATGSEMVEKFKSNAKAMFNTDMSDEEALDRVKAHKVLINGKADPVVGLIAPVLSEFANTFAQPLTALGVDNWKARTPSEALDKNARFDDYVSTIAATIKEYLAEAAKPDGEVDIVPTCERNAKIVALADIIEDYLIATRPLLQEEIDALQAKFAAEKAAQDAQPDLLPEQPAAPSMVTKGRKSK